jgi:A/G-specific adenine glycosylase
MKGDGAPEAADARRTRRLQKALLAWYAREKRDLPWRSTRDPYAIWLSEVMLQQTRVETVLPYYGRFLSALPSVHALAEAPLEDVLRLWSGLGYYRRARMFHAAARQVERDHGGRIPRTAGDLALIQGIGRYTAGAVASIAWGEAVPAVDGNVARVLSRLFAVDGDPARGTSRERIWELATSLVAPWDPSSWNQALMELGATTCVPRHPRCSSCPVGADCDARARGLTEELPRIRVKKRPALLHRAGFVLGFRGRVFLGLRPQNGLFGGMWEPPHADAEAIGEVAEELARRTMGRVVRAGVVTHVLSHRRIEMTVYAGQVKRTSEGVSGNLLPDYEAFEWIAADRLSERPLTSLAKKVLRAGGVVLRPSEHPRTSRR